VLYAYRINMVLFATKHILILAEDEIHWLGSLVIFGHTTQNVADSCPKVDAQTVKQTV